MDIQDLQKQWGQQYDGGHDSNLVIQLFKESRHTKISSKLKELTFHSVLFMIFNLIVIIYTWLVLIEHFANPAMTVQAILLLLLSKIVFYKNVLQLHGLSKINYAEPIVKLQKVVERLKLQRIRHNRFIFTFCNLYFWLIVFVVFQWDVVLIIQAVWESTPIVVIIHLGMFLVWFPLSVWLLKKYDMPDGVSKFWTKMKRESFLTDQSINFSLNSVLSYLEEIEGFEGDKNHTQKPSG